MFNKWTNNASYQSQFILKMQSKAHNLNIPWRLRVEEDGADAREFKQRKQRARV